MPRLHRENNSSILLGPTKNFMEEQKLFYQMYNKWKYDTRYLSYHDTEHPDYKSIVAMGKDIVPLLLSNLWDSWLPIVALNDIVGSPFEVLPDDQGHFDKLNEKWYKWGEYHGYI